MTIRKFTGDFRFLSNFWPVQILYEGLLYPSVEHAYQAAKTLDIHARVWISASPSPAAAKANGRRLVLRPDWEIVKRDVMLELVRQKFTVPSLSRALLLTGTEELVEENHWGDRYWGVCNGVGENHLGQILMQVRRELHVSQ